jgi:hypothetical protein
MVRDFLLGTTEKTRKRRILTFANAPGLSPGSYSSFVLLEMNVNDEHLHHARAAAMPLRYCHWHGHGMIPVAISSVSIYSKLQ